MLKASEIYAPSYDGMFGAKFKQGRSCGFAPIDKCGFLKPGEVTVLFSRAPWVRSALAMNLAAKMSMSDEEGGGVLVVSPRLAADEYIGSLAKMMAEINSWRLTRGLVTKAERAAESARYDEAIAKLKDARLCFEDELCIEPDAILSAARSAYRECGLGLVIVDQLQDLGCGTLKNGPVGWGVVGSRLHQLAALYEIPVLVLSGTTANEDITAGSVLRGYGCFREYVDQMIELARFENATEDGTAVFVLRHVSGPDYESMVKIQFSLKSFKVIDCHEWHKEPMSEPPELMEEEE